MTASAVSATILPDGFVIEGRYEVLAFIGSGGFAQVYACQDKAIERRVAIKVLNPMLPLRNEKSEDTEARRVSLEARFRREASCAARIRHPNVVTIHDFGVMQEPPRPYIVMELLDGADLQETLQGGERIAATVALPMFVPCLVALGKGHELGIVHKDLKPANLVLDEGILRLVDFGIARVEGQKDLTASAQIMGTAQYLAPEYIRSQNVTPAVDVYQMGLILSEVLTGQAVVQEENPLACVMRHGSGDVRPPQMLLDTPIGPVLERALQHLPGDRYPDGRAFAEALAAVDAQAVEQAILLQGIDPAMTLRTSSPGLRLDSGPARVDPDTGGHRGVVPVPVRADGQSAHEHSAPAGSAPAGQSGPAPAPSAASDGTSDPTPHTGPVTPNVPPRRQRAPTIQESIPVPDEIDVGATLPESVTPPPEVLALGHGKPPSGSPGTPPGTPPGNPPGNQPGSQPGNLQPPVAPPPPSGQGASGARPGTVFAVAIVSLAALGTLGMLFIVMCGGLASLMEDDEPVVFEDTDEPEEPEWLAGPEEPVFVDSEVLPVAGSQFLGPIDAPVTIIEFSEFQCPFCSRVNPTIKQLRDAYPNDIRVVFKHNPLSFHKEAPLAAEASLAAAEQGKFWEYHDKLFANQKALQPPDLERYAQELQLDMAAFRGALDSGRHKGRIAQDQALANQVGARGTPNFFVNGTKVVGAKPLEAFKEVIDAELPLARGSTYAERVAANFTKEEPADKPKDRPPSDDPLVYRVPLGSAPIKGPSTALVTIVEFSEFQCPFCSRVEPTLQHFLDDPRYRGKVRIAFKNLPLPFHDRAEPAALAALAAGEQGKYWAYHDVLFANQTALDDDSLQTYARQLNLDVARFNDARTAQRLKDQVEADKAQARTFGARGTPHFFINGRRLSGAQPLEKFQELVDAALSDAAPLAASGLSGDPLYNAIVANGATEWTAEP